MEWFYGYEKNKGRELINKIINRLKNINKNWFVMFDKEKGFYITTDNDEGEIAEFYINEFGEDDIRFIIESLLYISLESIDKNIILKFLETQLEYLNQIAWEYISKNNKFIWDKYKDLWNHPIWYLGVKTRERFEEIKTGTKPEGAFHHKPPYRNHLLTLFTTGIFTKNHKKGKINKNDRN